MNNKKHILSCSFGKDSLATAILAHIHNEPVDLVLYSHVKFDENISGEHPEHINFIYDKAIPKLKEWGFDIKIVESNDTYISRFYHVLKRSKYPERIGKYSGFPICGMCVMNREGKTNPIKRFYKNKNMKDIIQYVGIALDEPKRLETMKKSNNQISLLEKYKYTEQMAYNLCKQYDLLSPIYSFTKRGGCWFCPNCKYNEFLYVKNNHPELWDRLLELGKEKNTVSTLFNRDYTLFEIDKYLEWVNKYKSRDWLIDKEQNYRKSIKEEVAKLNQ